MNTIVPAAVPSMAIGGVALILGLISLGGDLQSKRQVVRQVDRFQQSESLRAQREITKLEADKAIARAAEKNRISAPKELIITDYVKNPTRPELDWNTVVNPNDCVIIRDRFRQQVGWAYGGQYYSIENVKNLCNEVNP
ncbi:MAG: hypothetical protein SWY16_27115 [Cyanobacteriota bacterium]|nr:hypothetical protein [Cyanobacteriota bacterium]